MVKIYIVRHCEAEGQAADAQLTTNGMEQANQLADFLSTHKIDRILSSPYLRAIQSIEPFSKRTNIQIEEDERLKERVLSNVNLIDWLEKLEKTYDNLTLTYEGGESSIQAMDRIVTVVEESLNAGCNNLLLVTHGNIMSLLLLHYDSEFGFNEWKQLSNPDVYVISDNDGWTIERIWMEND